MKLRQFFTEAIEEEKFSLTVDDAIVKLLTEALKAAIEAGHPRASEMSRLLDDFQAGGRGPLFQHSKY